ncbi:MAG: M24 family metallopeptidase [Ktedonobacterales bacterium]
MEERQRQEHQVRADDGLVGFSDAEFTRRFAQVQAMMDREGLDALIVYGNTSAYGEVQFLTDFRVTREAMLVFPRDGDPVLFVQYFNHVPLARRVARLQDVRWGGADTAAAVAEEISHRGWANQRLGIIGLIPWQRYRVLRELLLDASLIDVTVPMQRLRLVKSAEELAHLRHGAELSDLAIEALEREACPGISEHALAAIVECTYLGLGGQTHIHYMGSTPMRNPSLCVPSQQQSNRVLERGDVLITEISAQYHGYPGQILRPFTIGEPPTAAYQRLYDVAVEAYERVATVIHAGVAAEAVMDAAECIHAGGYSICDDLVHGFGGGYLQPVIRTRQTGGTQTPSFTLEENMTVVIQPNVITLDEQMGLQVGELVRVTRTGVESLHRYPMKFIQCG